MFVHTLRPSNATVGLAALALLAAVVLGRPADAQMESFAHAAAQARRSVVTVRVTLPIDSKPQDEEDDPLAEPKAPANRVTVCTGLVVAPRLIVTAAFASNDSVVRVTTPSGQRDTAQLRVLDEYTGLMLIETDSLRLTPFQMSDKAAEAGQWTIAAAGWGAEDPVVSFGVISGVDREQPGYPPLLQLDVRTLDTSSGAAVLGTKGKLQGIVVAVEDMRPRGLSYAIPVRHIQRLLRVWKTQVESDDSGTPPTVILRRRRPEAGLVLRGDNQNGMSLVVVQRVHEGGPAEQAGFAVGDEVVSVGGVQIRSVYEAVRPVLSRQPGDTLTYRVRNDDGVRDLTLVLGGGVALPSASLKNVTRLIRPKLEIEGLPSGIRPRSTAPKFLANADQDSPVPADKRGQALLQKAQEAHLRVIAAQQEKLRELQRQREEDQRQLQLMKQQLEELKTMLEKP